MLSSRDAFGTPHPTDAIDPCGAAIFIILMRDVAVCSKAHSRSGFAGTARDTRRRARRGSVAMCGSTHRRGRCFFIIDSSWRPAMKRGRPTSHANDALRVRGREWRRSFAAAWSHAAGSGRAGPGTGAPSIAWCRPGDALSPRPVEIPRARAACTPEPVRCRSRVCTAVVIFRRAGFRSRRAGWRVAMAIVLHCTTRVPAS